MVSISTVRETPSAFGLAQVGCFAMRGRQASARAAQSRAQRLVVGAGVAGGVDALVGAMMACAKTRTRGERAHGDSACEKQALN